MAHLPTDELKIIAHRGLCREAPENTLAAFQMAHDAGVTWLETDVDLIADGTPVLIHDDTLDRTTNRKGPVAALTAQDLANTDAGSWFSKDFAGEPIPTLHTLVDFLNRTGMNCNVELKSRKKSEANPDTLIKVTLAELSRLSANVQIIISSFDTQLLAQFHEAAPHYTIAALFKPRALTKGWVEKAHACSATYVHPKDHRRIASLLPVAHREGFRVQVWTVNKKSRARDLLTLGVDGIITNKAGKFLPLLTEQAH
ncbi:glycerophosphodiester phosphodiesterase family protein [Ancrocorticia sp.]|uniref:glycerophosphodiester phosphodiesterase family protein n=1 Tax=Ancrocorticia sp. TaxID=2593684 RepID=UPI003F92F168